MLCVNMLIEWRQPGQEDPLRIERVLWLDLAGGQVVLFDVEDEKALAEVGKPSRGGRIHVFYLCIGRLKG